MKVDVIDSGFWGSMPQKHLLTKLGRSVLNVCIPMGLFTLVFESCSSIQSRSSAVNKPQL